jgi:hypothetical protein
MGRFYVSKICISFGMLSAFRFQTKLMDFLISAHVECISVLIFCISVLICCIELILARFLTDFMDNIIP